ncbi:MAG: PQQ-binding-like beta-propeller repeat protein [Anaerolineae bacterium]|nr:PQQ-binding-like beta-propeller repeat protein [Anaerolineae bacterium]
MPDTPSKSGAAHRNRINWALLAGSLLVIIITVLSFFGPGLAPKDPREHNLIIRVAGQWLTPPYSAFTPGFPLGSDNLGRDLYSWLLWSIRPTMILVMIVASIRMALGVIIGVVAGWSDRVFGRLFDWLIAGALAVPTLIAALITITAVGFRLGVWAFVVGLSITGWAETAQLVRERTRSIKGQDAVEASVALGSSSAQTFFLHILPQVMPMIWMLLAFEVANTLVTSSGLGFLGYYLGGAVFTEVEDFVYQRISEMPELGQMLATAWLVLDEPWAMVAAGTVVFAIVLAFNLLGEGLQLRLTRKLGGARNLYSFMAGDVIPWLSKRITQPWQRISQKQAFRYNAGVILILLFGAVLVWVANPWSKLPSTLPILTPGPVPLATIESVSNAQDIDSDQSSDGTNSTPGQTENNPTSPLEVPGGHIYAAEGHDPWHARWVDFSGPLTTTIQWTLEREGGFAGGPVIDANGTLYVAARQDQGDGEETGSLIALDSSGSVIWETPFDRKPVGAPALTADGTIIVADKKGINAFSPEGALSWQHTTTDQDSTTSSPVISRDGAIIYKTYGGLQALELDGSLRWRTTLTESAATQAPHISMDGTVVFWRDLAFDIRDGSAVDVAAFTSLASAPDQVVIGADGLTYFRYGEQLIWTSLNSTISNTMTVFDATEYTWDARDAGVTPSGTTWMIARPPVGGMGLGLYWATPEGELSAKLSVPGQRDIQSIGVDLNNIAYLCMNSYEAESRCVASEPTSSTFLWNFPLRGIKIIAGAALAPGRLYVATGDGLLYAIGQELSGSDGAAGDTEVPPPAVADPGPAWSSPTPLGNHLWSMPGGDSWRTNWTGAAGPRAATVQWTYDIPQGLNGAPVIDKDGQLYVCTQGAELIALTPQGKVTWRASTPAGLIGSPALGAGGTIYATDEAGFLNAFDNTGNLSWRYHPTGIVNNPTYSNSGRIIREEPVPIDTLEPAGAGPLVAPDGTLYYSLGVETWQHEQDTYFRSEVMLAVSPEGEGLYDPSFIWSDRQPARLYATGDYLFWGDVMLYPLDGKIDREKPYPYGEFINGLFEEYGDIRPHAGIGADGRAYLAFRRTIITWFVTDAGVDRLHTFTWEPEKSPGYADAVGQRQMACAGFSSAAVNSFGLTRMIG